MANITTNKTSHYDNKYWTFLSSSDEDLQPMIARLETIYKPNVTASFQEDFQKTIDIMKAFRDNKTPGFRLHLLIATERVLMRPAVSVKVQMYENDVMVEMKTCIFVYGGPTLKE